MAPCVEIVKKSIATTEAHMNDRIAFVIDEFENKNQFLYLTTCGSKTLEFTFKIKNHHIAMIASEQIFLNYGFFHKHYVGFYICNNALKRSVIPANLIVQSKTVFGDRDCQQCNHPELINQLKKSYVSYVRSLRYRNSNVFDGRKGVHNGRNITLLHYSLNYPSVVISRDINAAYIYEVPGNEIEVVGGITFTSEILKHVHVPIKIVKYQTNQNNQSYSSLCLISVLSN
eukprot:NODE_189_length_13483_cov_0.581067.p3 type:complete len:229 gc:universal NODE_189_length_13483_cov_0.581067:10700-10014(-)